MKRRVLRSFCFEPLAEGLYTSNNSSSALRGPFRDSLDGPRTIVREYKNQSQEHGGTS